tara:strand:- start:167 stop:421 length:255 start_codon:yes stop_codon:yes gene_type:complete
MSKNDITLIKKAKELQLLSRNLDEKIFDEISKDITETEVLDKLTLLKNNSDCIFNSYMFSNKEEMKEKLESIYTATVHLLYSLS